MGKIIAGGWNEYPWFMVEDPKVMMGRPTGGFTTRLKAPDLDPKYKNLANWPAPMLAEYGEDEGVASAVKFRDRVVASMRMLRSALDEFAPDFVLIWSKEQMENFGEDVMPPYAIYAYDQMRTLPHARLGGQNFGPNVWGESADTEFTYKGDRKAAKYLTSKLIDSGFDATYAYKPLHSADHYGSDLAHTFEGGLSYLDWDRRGFPYPVVPFYVNGYGHSHLSRKGYSNPDELDPSAPRPWRCFDLGRATGRILRESPWRVAVLALSSWSHAGILEKNSFLFPDVEEDRRLFELLRTKQYQAWRNLDPDELILHGQQEMYSWICLAGLLEELQMEPTFLDFAETWTVNCTKVTAVFNEATP